MEMSSPLAAMHPPPVPAWGHRHDLAGSAKLFAGGIGSKNLNFNFRDMSMKKGYFQMKPPQGSSPTASLAADMSSNLHVDQRYSIP
jgi:M-phase inducer tyrosine phosphatase